MKTIRYDSKFRTAVGQPFPIQNPDVLAQVAARDAARERGAVPEPSIIVDPTFAQVMQWFANNIPHTLSEDGKTPRKLTPKDTGHAYAVIKAFQDPQDETVVLEDEVYKWLVELNTLDGPAAFRVTQAVVAERLEDLVQKEKKAG